MPGIKSCFRITEVTENCIRAHQNSVDATVDDALGKIRTMLVQSIQSLKDGKFKPGTSFLVGYGIKHPGEEDS